jgi:hypothetical protein
MLYWRTKSPTPEGCLSCKQLFHGGAYEQFSSVIFLPILTGGRPISARKACNVATTCAPSPLEVLLGADDIPGDLAERYGYVNRALPDAELDAFVDELAVRIASFDKQAIAETKNFANVASLPPDAEIAPEWGACIAINGGDAGASGNAVEVHGASTTQRQPLRFHGRIAWEAGTRPLTLECGYSSAALRERLYVGEGARDMAGLFIYTSTPDSAPWVACSGRARLEESSEPSPPQCARWNADQVERRPGLPVLAYADRRRDRDI